MAVPKFGKPSHITGTDADNYIHAFNGDSTLEGGWGNDTLVGSTGNDMIIGGLVSLVNKPDNNLLDGGAGNDTLIGHMGDDTLIGGDGNDRLSGQGGKNLLLGGAGDDVFVFGYGAPTVPARLVGNDVIIDFQHGHDKIDLAALNYLGGTADVAYTFIGGALFSGKGPEVRVVQEGFTTKVQLDTQYTSWIKADGVADASITLFGAHHLTRDDFIL